jgi:hypothetical protein
MSIALGTYIQFTERDGTVTNNAFQNFHRAEVRTYNGVDYTYGAFGFSGAAVDINGANIQAQLIFGLNNLILNIAQTAANEFWVVRVNTVWLNPDDFDETAQRLEEVYAVVGFEHDNSRISLRLGSPLDSVQSDFPRRVLTQRTVGVLPTTGNVSFV